MHETFQELSALAATGQITRAYRLVDPPEGYRWAGWIAGAFAAAALFGIDYYTHYILSGQSDTMIVALCLGAIDCYLYRRYRWAFALGILAALGRPETFPLIGLYAIWLWLKFPRLRPLVGGGLLLLPVMWFGIPRTRPPRASSPPGTSR